MNNGVAVLLIASPSPTIRERGERASAAATFVSFSSTVGASMTVSVSSGCRIMAHQTRVVTE